MLTTIIVVILILLLIGALPTWPYMSGYNYGYYPSGIFLVLLIIILILIFSDRLAF
jgi:Protein of unknown function (DUF3309)